MKLLKLIGPAAFVSAAVLGCASIDRQEAGRELRERDEPAVAIDGASPQFRIAVSPAGDTLSMIPRVGRVLGTGVDVVVNERYRVAFRDALADYNPGEVLLAALDAKFATVLGEPPNPVSPLGTTAGFDSLREAEANWLEGLATQEYGTAYDIQANYGLYGSGVELHLTLGGKAVALPEMDRLWSGEIEAVPGPLLADLSFKNPLQRLVPYFNKPELSAEGDMITALQADQGALLKAAYEEALSGAIEAMFDDMGLQETAMGQHWLGRDKFRSKDWKEAVAHLEKALQLAGGDRPDLRSDLSVALARAKDLDGAIEQAEAVVAATPDYGPALYNLAYWHAVERDDPATARSYYDRALAAGMEPSAKIAKKLERAKN